MIHEFLPFLEYPPFVNWGTFQRLNKIRMLRYILVLQIKDPFVSFSVHYVTHIHTLYKAINGEIIKILSLSLSLSVMQHQN